MLPVCYFPTTVAFLDDHHDTLTSLPMLLDEPLLTRLFDRPSEALSVLKADSRFEYIMQRCLADEHSAAHLPQVQQVFSLDLSPIHWEIYNDKRFSEMSVLVVDYSMPGMNGVEVCRSLANSPIKKILLTGQVDEHLAVRAFNERLIDAFIHKSDPNLREHLNQNINHLQKEYFSEMSDFIKKMISLRQLKALRDSLFIQFFERFLAEHRIVEYYLMDTTGSFLCLNAQAEPYFFGVMSESDVSEYLELLEDHQAPLELLSRLRDRSHMPLYGARTVWNFGGFGTSMNALVPCQVLRGDVTYYVSWTKGRSVEGVDLRKVLSYNGYLAQAERPSLLSETEAPHRSGMPESAH